ncbi:threonylcarbamoyl-AMP synthase [Candidatus Sumerlaeota bacterium]|nr:threonylcarbamoyl-AMP synthase [Candidatus Sumerlaeota bacterium]
MNPLRIDSADPDSELIERAVDALLDGGLVVFPTDTLYGLGCDATNPRAVARLCEVKGRSPDAPLPVIINHRRLLAQLVEDIPPEITPLLDRFWPGPLTIVLRRRGEALRAVSPTGTLGVRIPDAPVALRLARGLCRPIVATSANRTGLPPCVTAQEVEELFGAEIQLILDAGPIPGGQPSTVLDLSSDRPQILREGVIARALLRRYLPEIPE